MTREEARQRALSMPHIKALMDARDHLENMEWRALEILVADGRVAIGNPKAIGAVKEALLALLWKQIENNEERQKSEPVDVPDKLMFEIDGLFGQEWLGIDVLSEEGSVGIGNPDAIKTAKDAMEALYKEGSLRANDGKSDNDRKGQS